MISVVFVMMVAMVAWAAAVAVAASFPAEAAAAGTGSGANVTMLQELAIAVDFSNGTNNNLDWKPTKQAVDQQQLQPRRFRHEGSAVRVLYQNGVSIFDFR